MSQRCAVRLLRGAHRDPVGSDVLRSRREPGCAVPVRQEQLRIPSSQADCGVDEGAVEEQVAEED
ncbi:hypothetical protein COO55_00060 [Rhodococcus opacus]|nr:hypothetical protein AXA44_08955 [Rhodococcus sp. SC4]KXX58057.1 hypothetical protein AZG88_46910 [Rhodococcus sp. LB1]RKM70637.1 hypothetical protein COO55_00060 [Rhodococcus opacus]